MNAVRSYTIVQTWSIAMTQWEVISVSVWMNTSGMDPCVKVNYILA